MLVAACIWPATALVRRLAIGGVQNVKGKRTIAERVTEYGPAVRNRRAGDFKRVGVAYPPRKIVLVGLKQERRLEVWVADRDGHFKLLKTYPILAASGHIGPKLKEGDKQVPEGLYAIESLNPNSLFHLALRVNYPNEHDRARARTEGRTNLGGDIMIHGSNVSVGCLAMGDEVAEDLFILAAETGIGHITVILSPVDFRVHDLPTNRPALPKWTGDLYAKIKAALHTLGKQPEPGPQVARRVPPVAKAR